MNPTRRTFLKTSGIMTASSFLAAAPLSIAESRIYKAAVIGRTGRGDYGHGLDTIFGGLENVTLVAVADENRDGLKSAMERSGALRAYDDYRDMLDKEKPNLVGIAPRQPDCHREMALAAIEIGAHIYMEKPITEYPKEADDIVDAARKKGVKVGIAHTRRFMDGFLMMKTLLEEDYLGTVLEIRFQGKQDARVGGEDLIVLGSHDMDIMRFFLGDPQWCYAAVTVDGRDITPADVRPGKSEPYTVAGDTIRADYRFANNIQCHWSSMKAKDWNQSVQIGSRSVNKWGFDIYGTQRILSFQETIGTFVLDSPVIAPGDSAIQWKPIEEIVKLQKPDYLAHPIRNLIHAIETDGQPQCTAEDARWAVEMVCATYHSQKAKARVSFPLNAREHPLRDWRE